MGVRRPGVLISNIRFSFGLAALSLILFSAALLINELVFVNSEYVRGINWVYLPAGVRILCVLLFGLPGAVGVFIASWFSSVYYYFPHDALRAIVGAFISAIAPFLAYHAVRRGFRLRAGLENLTPSLLFVCCVACAVANAGSHHVWFALNGQTGPELIRGLPVMALGDLMGAVIVLYGIKALLALSRRRRKPLSP